MLVFFSLLLCDLYFYENIAIFNQSTSDVYKLLSMYFYICKNYIKFFIKNFYKKNFTFISFVFITILKLDQLN